MKTETRTTIEYSTQPAPRSGISWLGVASCLVVLVSVWLFVRNWGIAHRIPINRSIETLGLYTYFLDFWSRVFPGLALLGCALGMGGIFVGRRRRTLAFLGLVLNAVALGVLMILGSTGGDMVDRLL